MIPMACMLASAPRGSAASISSVPVAPKGSQRVPVAPKGNAATTSPSSVPKALGSHHVPVAPKQPAVGTNAAGGPPPVGPPPVGPPAPPNAVPATPPDVTMHSADHLD